MHNVLFNQPYAPKNGVSPVVSYTKFDEEDDDKIRTTTMKGERYGANRSKSVMENILGRVRRKPGS